jgi:membrane associated rhomboid family serine protease
VVARKVGGDMRALWGLIIVNVFITFAVPNISWQGHLGGFLGGGIVAAILVYAPRGRRRTVFQVCGLVAVAALLAVAMIARGAALA